jgi:hypothetical protein
LVFTYKGARMRPKRHPLLAAPNVNLTRASEPSQARPMVVGMLVLSSSSGNAQDNT